MKYDFEYVKKQPSRIIEQVGLSKGLRVLDVGTGKGFMSIPLAKRGYNVVSIDENPDIQQEAIDEAKNAGVELDFQKSSLTKFSLQDDSFDAVFIFNTLHHIEQKSKTISEMIRVLRVGGKLIVVEMNEIGMQVANTILKTPCHDHPLKDVRELLEEHTKEITVHNGEIMDTYIAVKR